MQGTGATRRDAAAQAGFGFDQLQCGHQLLREDNGVGEGTGYCFIANTEPAALLFPGQGELYFHNWLICMKHRY